MKQTSHLTDNLGDHVRFLKMNVNGKLKLIAYPAEPADQLEARLAELVPVCLGRPGKQ